MVRKKPENKHEKHQKDQKKRKNREKHEYYVIESAKSRVDYNITEAVNITPNKKSCYMINIFNYVTESQEVLQTSGIKTFLDILRDHHYIYADGVVQYLIHRNIVFPPDYADIIRPFTAIGMEIVCILSDIEYDNIQFDVIVFDRPDLFRDILFSVYESLEKSVSWGYILGYSHRFVPENAVDVADIDMTFPEIIEIVSQDTTERSIDISIQISIYKLTRNKKIRTNERKISLISSRTIRE